MNWLNFFLGVGLFGCGLSVGLLIAEQEVDTALRLLKEAKAYHDEIRAMLQRLRESSQK